MLLRFLSQSSQVCEHKCHLTKSQSCFLQASTILDTSYAHEVIRSLIAIFLLMVLLIFKNVQKPIFLFLDPFFRKSEKFMLTKFSPVKKLMVSMVSPRTFWQLSERLFIFGHF